jgi:putative ABC transport system ATP-binding protein
MDLRLSHVSKSFAPLDAWDEPIVLYTDLDMSFGSWSFVSLMGTSGIGKTTLLNMIAWISAPTSWEIYVDNIPLSTLTVAQKAQLRWTSMGFIFQQFNLLPYLTAQENIELPLQLHKLPRRYETNELLEIVWLSKKWHAYPHQLSGWEQQRVAIARAIIGTTNLLLADEPTWNLDKNTSERIMQLLVRIHKDIGCTILMITHDMHIASFADQHFLLTPDWLIPQ